MFREKVRLDGSARRALAINPPFKHYVFIEQNAGRFSALQRLSDENPGRGIEARMGDGNQVLGELFGSPPWSTQINGQGLHRAVVFLDPYNMAVRWSTLRSLAVTGAVDVWYLFPLSAVVRQLAHDLSSVDAGKRAALTEIFGTADWEDELYKHKIQGNLWDEAVVSARRSVSQRQIEMYAKARLETLFPQVSDPLPLVTPRNAQLFSLFCASANSSPAARALVTKGVSHVLKRYG